MLLTEQAPVALRPDWFSHVFYTVKPEFEALKGQQGSDQLNVIYVVGLRWFRDGNACNLCHHHRPR